ncbi:MAG: hydrogenase/urease maturation nickel metallochaperone HypA [Candidatus Omnitrophica bacterium]|nr:hydrogenase/urease maturation nickel metallochaperone HypA [Candidatus Omnitrophota bacterium]
MHEAHLINSIFSYLETEEERAGRPVKKIYVSISEFSNISEEHFRQHYREQSQGTRWESLDIEIKKIPYGKEFRIDRIEFM